jgi:hypothetical protein
MKPKISPEEYKKTLDNIDLESIYITDSKAKLNKEFLEKDLQLDISEKNKFNQDEKGLSVQYSFSLKGNSPNKEKAGVEISVTYNIYYSKKENQQISEDFFNPFSKFILGMMVWTYFREFVQNMVSRMNLPPLTLPLKRL